ncbi:radical SAM protein [Paenibacillus sp. ClWae2A]|uniref:coproporphyrinogen-III oxidase family protein n=1 Tax=Paenibacillus sp. ClWae2A TaxID=3057177 RepID=UPI0028F58ACF|nr:radical SAM protein [Paenibacillus sp. ClWae2A]MDT9721099.1 radical SAM protein [Paenibacillus sp. ClWae2A]
MLNPVINPRKSLLKFDFQLPVYNWYYPFPNEEDNVIDTTEALEAMPPSSTQGRRALYFHIPFCDTLCTFCPFFRSSHYTAQEKTDAYMDALIREMKWKASFSGIGQVPVDVISVGGGTPSVLTVEQILRFGEALHGLFDLSRLQEFTFELEVKSVTRDKLQAMKNIGVNRVSFGIQTFHPVYRQVFNITSTVEQVREVARMAMDIFSYVNVDMIFGLAGQSLDDLLKEADQAMSLNTTTIDFYPLNYMSASLKMHRLFKENHLQPLSPATKISYRMFLDEYMRAKGYIPINGYSYTLDRKSHSQRVLIDRDPIFKYHDLLYGYETDEVIGFGASAVTQTLHFSSYNSNTLKIYMEEMYLDPLQLSPLTLGNKECPEKGIVYFPYRGVLDKSRIDWERVPSETLEALSLAVAEGLVEETDDQYELTPAGWLSYVNLVYYLTPDSGKRWLNERIEQRIAEGRERDEVQLYESLQEGVVAK